MTGPITASPIPTDQRDGILPLIPLPDPGIDAATLAGRLGEMAGQGQQCAGACHGAHPAGVCGLWVTTRFSCGRQVEPDGGVVHPEHPSQGVGRRLMAWAYEYALALGCEACELNPCASSVGARRFDLNEGSPAWASISRRSWARPETGGRRGICGEPSR